MDKLFIAILNNTLVASWIIFAVIVLRFIIQASFDAGIFSKSV